MSAELKDFRGKITCETDAVLEAMNRATGRDKSEIAREVLHKWAMEQVHTATLIERLMKAEGCAGESGGARAASRGVGREDGGAGSPKSK